ncbi:MAG TPA: hypothetical protein VM238_04150 [Phycisphaerae bacterium]|nr:hypothetical protein [Phycisphaerae bacterium]
MVRILMASLVAASLTGAAAAAESKEIADPKGAAGDATVKTTQTDPAKAEDRGWFSRLNPFSPLVDPEAKKKTDPNPPPEGTLPQDVAGAAVAPEASQTQQEKAEGQATMPVLNGILFSERLVIAIVSDAIAKTGDLVDGYRIISITEDTVVAAKQGGRYIMTTRRPQAQLDTPAQAAPRKPTDPAAPGSDPESPSSGPAQTADKTGVGPPGPDTGASESIQAASDEAEQKP